MPFREWAALLLSLCVIGVIGALGFAHFSSGLFSHVFSEGSTREGVNPRTAAILMQTDPGHCQQFTFDNDTGLIHPAAAESCDAHGAPVPVGTMKRLDAISKSFSGR